MNNVGDDSGGGGRREMALEKMNEFGRDDYEKMKKDKVRRTTN